ncbi:MAG: GNAT family N-acetyltransferase [Planctomycetes bacterium]|nr:GNAT family N-acetyltransferase [Planctomycetota bacterium]
MAKEVVIRKAVVEDVSSIIELWKELMDFHKERDRIFSRSATGHERFSEYLITNIQSDMSCVFVAADGKDLVGYCMAKISKYPPVLEQQAYGEIDSIAVTENYRRSRIGKRLLNEIREWYSEEGISRIEARVSKYNKAGIEFWAEMGFTPYLETVFMEVQQDK